MYYFQWKEKTTPFFGVGFNMSKGQICAVFILGRL